MEIGQTDSEEHSTDEQLKKRRFDSKDEAELFGKSKRIQRTPTKKRDEDKLDKILNMIQDMKQDLKAEIQQIKVDQKEYIEDMKKLKIENEELKKENEEIREELTEIKHKLERIEREKRKNNIVLTGKNIDTTQPEMLVDEMSQFIDRNLNVKVHIKATYKIGRKICLIELTNEQDKTKIMQNKHKLKEIREERIFINNDLTREERDMQKQIRLIAREEKTKGNQVKVAFGKMWLNDVEWKWNKNKKKLETAEAKN